MPLRVKSVYSPIDRKNDGLRILVTRFRGRGMKANRYNVWMPSLGPSEKLLRGDLTKTWAQYAREYKRELRMDDPVDSRSKTIKNHGQKFTLRLIKKLAKKGNVTLMCHCAEDAEHCHRYVLRELILSTACSTILKLTHRPVARTHRRGPAECAGSRSRPRSVGRWPLIPRPG
jgi:uncharacterized protein YeaO (DUF488 family)